MHDFACTDPADMYYDVLAERVRYFKEDESGVAIMSRAMEKMWNEALEEGIMEGRVRMIAEILTNNGTEDDVRRLTRATEEEIRKAEELCYMMQ